MSTKCHLYLLAAVLLSPVAGWGQTLKTGVLQPDVNDAITRFDLKNVDRSADPCVDFYQYACGHWAEKHPMPPDRARWSNFTELTERNAALIRKILESPDAPGHSPITQKLSDFYASCMDQGAIQRKGGSPIRPDLNRIAAIKTKAGLIKVVAQNRARYGNVLFIFGAVRSFHDPAAIIAFLDQGGLTVPDRDFYLNDTSQNSTGRQFFLEAVKQEFALIGDMPEVAARNADSVFEIEKQLAAASMDRIARRDLRNRDHQMSVAELERLAPNVHFDLYFKYAGSPRFTELNVANPDFFKSLDSLLQAVPLESWKAYLVFHLVRSASPFLSEEFEQTNFKATQMFTGQRELPPRWKKCTDATTVALRDALGQLFLQQTFFPADKASLSKMVAALETALRNEISEASWMSEDTRKEALAKVAVVRKEVGGPARWRDYSGLKIVRGDFLGNSFRAMEFEDDRLLQTIGKPVDNAGWNIAAFTVDAVNSGDQIVFPAGLLQPPFFDRAADDAVNYGSIGTLIGHEFVHILDDQGRNVDSKGRLRDWWSASDAQGFEKRANCILDQYGAFVVVDGSKLNAKLTLGENIADNGGTRMALHAFHNVSPEAGKSSVNNVEEYTPDQKFFLAFAQTWCEDTTSQSLRARLQTSSHSPPRWRVNGVLQNMSEFRNAFHCKDGQPMVQSNACTLW